MDDSQLKQSMAYLINKYTLNRENLITLIYSDPDSVKYILSEMDANRTCVYSDEDLDLIKEIAYYYA